MYFDKTYVLGINTFLIYCMMWIGWGEVKSIVNFTLFYEIYFEKQWCPNSENALWIINNKYTAKEVLQLVVSTSCRNLEENVCDFDLNTACWWHSTMMS